VRDGVESELAETVKKADLREAAIIVCLQEIDDITQLPDERVAAAIVD